MSRLIFSIVLLSLVYVGFQVVPESYTPVQTFMISTAGGKQIKLTCPVVQSKNEFVNVIDGRCLIEPQRKD